VCTCVYVCVRVCTCVYVCVRVCTCVYVYLPEFLQLVDLLGGDLSRAELLLLRGDLHQPGQEAAVLDQRLPLGAVPVDVLQAALAGARLPAEGGREGGAGVRGQGVSSQTMSEARVWAS